MGRFELLISEESGNWANSVKSSIFHLQAGRTSWCGFAGLIDPHQVVVGEWDRKPRGGQIVANFRMDPVIENTLFQRECIHLASLAKP